MASAAGALGSCILARWGDTAQLKARQAEGLRAPFLLDAIFRRHTADDVLSLSFHNAFYIAGARIRGQLGSVLLLNVWMSPKLSICSADEGSFAENHLYAGAPNAVSCRLPRVCLVAF